jgi:hypothetical protein
MIDYKYSYTSQPYWLNLGYITYKHTKDGAWVIDSIWYYVPRSGLYLKDFT